MQKNAKVIEIFTQPICYKSQNGIQRCVLKDTEYFPPNFVSKTHNGFGNLVQNLIRSTRRVAADTLSNYKSGSVANATETINDFWFLYEVSLGEAEAGASMALLTSEKTLLEALAAGNLAANVSYAIGLALSLVVFLWIFASVRASILVETKFSRGVLYMVPHDVLRNTKAMIEYIEALSVGLNGQ